jgi:phosphohistidine phosphatase SixA
MVAVIAVRHADVDLPPPSDDASLNDAGRARSAVLARSLGDAGVTSILVSSRKRTQQTAAPLAKELGLQPHVIDDPAPLAPEIRAGDHGPVLLVVGHSNTVPGLINALGAGTVPPIGEAEFDHLYVVTVLDTAAEVLSLHYGAGGPGDR